MIVDIILGLAVIVLGISHICMGRAVRELMDARRPVDFLARRRQLEADLLRVRAVNRVLFAPADIVLTNDKPS